MLTVNFIHGQNGSGKSAVLAALQICLGAGARRTNRARNLRELVRHEAGPHCVAKVRVTLWNEGDDGFEPDVYGDTIMIERHIPKSGSGYNGYKLLDAQGQEKSRSKQELDRLLDHLNIQVENPVAVLDQEEAKKFLTGKPEDKYKFFCKATELERMDRTYLNVVEHMQELSTKQQHLEKKVQPSLDQVKRLKHEWQRFEQLDKLEEKKLDLEAMYAWARFHDYEREAQKVYEVSVYCLVCRFDCYNLTVLLYCCSVSHCVALRLRLCVVLCLSNMHLLVGSATSVCSS